MKRVGEMDGGDGCKTMGIYLTLLNRMFKLANMLSFVSILSGFKKLKIIH